jgi:hypothetical protein
MCQPADVVIDGDNLLYNDLFRAVHDAFGHILHPNDFGIRGELRAAFAQARMHSEQAIHALFTETVGQICWFNYGPHMLDPDGKHIQSTDPAYLPPSARPFPEQKAFLFPGETVHSYLDAFAERSP